jgi:type IX secretion system PorP/SprF family membrane protein
LKKWYLHIIIFLLLTKFSFAQQTPLYSQYMFNPFVINPAFTGTNDGFEVMSNYRHQWVGITDAPKTYILTLHGPHKFKNYGIGGTVFSDVTGPTSRTGLGLSYAYHFKLSEETKVSLGLSGGLLQFKLDGTKVTLADQGDAVLTNSMLTAFVPDFGFGAKIYKPNKYYFGISIPQFIQNRLQFMDTQAQSLSKLTSHIFINGAYRFSMGDNFSVEPSVLVKYAPPVMPQIDLGSKIIYKDIIHLGFIFRTQDAYSILLGYTTPDQKLGFGYAYDLLHSNLRGYSAGTHEIMIVARFGNSKAKSVKDKAIDKIDKMEQKLKKLEETEQKIEKSNDKPKESLEKKENTPVKKENTKSVKDLEKEKIQKEITDLENKDKELRTKVRDLREMAQKEGKSPSDAGFSKSQEYLKALDEIKLIYQKKQELDKKIAE